jgi:hypothetical protein
VEGACAISNLASGFGFGLCPRLVPNHAFLHKVTVVGERIHAEKWSESCRITVSLPLLETTMVILRIVHLPR